MNSGKQKAVAIAAGGATAAALVWLAYARSAAPARSFLGNAARKTNQKLGEIESMLHTVRVRVEEIDRLAREIAQVGSKQKARAEEVLTDTMAKLEQTTDVISENLTQSSNEIAALVKDIRSGVAQAVSANPSEAA